MAEDRKGFLLPEQEEVADALLELKGIWEKLDGPFIKIVDNVGLQKAKEKLQATNPEAIPVICMVVDTLFGAFPTVAEIKAMSAEAKKKVDVKVPPVVPVVPK